MEQGPAAKPNDGAEQAAEESIDQPVMFRRDGLLSNLIWCFFTHGIGSDN